MLYILFSSQNISLLSNGENFVALPIMRGSESQRIGQLLNEWGIRDRQQENYER